MLDSLDLRGRMVNIKLPRPIGCAHLNNSLLPLQMLPFHQLEHVVTYIYSCRLGWELRLPLRKLQVARAVFERLCAIKAATVPCECACMRALPPHLLFWFSEKILSVSPTLKVLSAAALSSNAPVLCGRIATWPERG